MGGDGLSLASLTDHEELRQDRHRLQVDGERPQDLMADTLTFKCARKLSLVAVGLVQMIHRESLKTIKLYPPRGRRSRG